MAEKKTESERSKGLCPLGKAFQGPENFSRNTPEFREHLGRSGLELLKAIRVLVDSKIDTLEKRKPPAKRKVARKITIE